MKQLNFPRLALALAAAAAAPSLWAQSTVTIYGAVDAYLGSQSGTGVTTRRVLNSSFNPNLLGFAGTEDLGGGLKAGFVLEHQPAMDTGGVGQGGKFWGRQSQVFLSGDWGRLSLGRLHTAARTFGIKYSATGWLTTDALGNLAIAAGSAMGPVMNIDSVGGRTNNAVNYSSPSFGGASFSLMQSFDEGGPFSAGAIKITQFGAGYTNGPFTADFVYNRIPDLAGSQIAQSDLAIGAQYRFSAVRVLVALFDRKAAAIAAPGSTSALPGTEGHDRTVIAGFSVPIGAHTIGASFGKLKVDATHRGRRAANMSAPFSASVDDATAWSLSYTYAISKRTQLFAAYGTLDNAAQGTAALTADLRPTPGGNSSLLASGLRVSF